MNSGMPELGSKISLISKADIRYEGRLFTVDPQECTIALASVRSFGTEDREAPFPVAPQNQVYDYILFRGSDIKDIRVVNNVSTLPNDPAIMQLSVPPSLGQQPFQGQGFQHPVLGTMAPQLAPFNNYGSVLDLIGGGSRSTTPVSLGSRKSPTNDQGVQAGGKKDDKKMVRPIQPPGQRQQHDRRDSRGDGQVEYQNRAQNRPQQNYQQHRSNQNFHPNNQHQPNQRGGWGNPRGNNMRQRGRARGSYQNPKQGGPPNQQGGKPKNTLKFENDYDFEQANTEFEELRSQLSKVKIDEVKPEINGDSDKKDDSGNETGAGEGEPEDGEHEIFYDKAKSFFDNISCEAVERSKGRSQRTDWRTERKLNSETFGVSSTRRGGHFYGYRGRGGFRGMGYRGGYRGGYNNRNNQGPRRDQQQQHPQQQQQNRQSQAPPSANKNVQSSGTIQETKTAAAPIASN